MDYSKIHNWYIRNNIRGRYYFLDNRKGFKKLCLVLIGYKEVLWDDVIGRLKRFLPSDVEVCLVSSGRKLDALNAMAEENGWSYLATKKNNVCLVQNIAINLFKDAELIYKMDEDIFLTEGFFQKLEAAYNRALAESHYHVGAVAPILNVNAYGFFRLLEIYGKLDEYESRFGRAYIAAGDDEAIETNAEAARFMWGEGGYLPQIDMINRELTGSGRYGVNTTRLSIGCFMMTRAFWDSFWRYPVVPGNGMGLDEAIVLGASTVLSQAFIVAEDSAVGHFGFKTQWKGMYELYQNHRELFQIPEL